MTIYETLKYLSNLKMHKIEKLPLKIKFIDVVQQMEQINGKKYSLFDYKKIENTLKIFNIYTAEHISSEAENILNGNLIGKSESYIDEYQFRAGMVDDLDDGDLCVIYLKNEDPKLLRGWKDFQHTLKEQIKEMCNYD